MYASAGMPYAAFWIGLSLAFSDLPLVGISLTVLPMSIILIMDGDAIPAIIMLIGICGFANWIDMLIRPKLVPIEAYLTMLNVLLGRYCFIC